MAKSKMLIPKDVEFQGNNGGSYVRIQETEQDDIILLSVGHDCVGVFKKRISVFALAAALANIHDCGGFESSLEKYYNGEVPEWAKPY